MHLKDTGPTSTHMKQIPKHNSGIPYLLETKSQSRSFGHRRASSSVVHKRHDFSLGTRWMSFGISVSQLLMRVVAFWGVYVYTVILM